ncbi:MAG: hypothetical protein ABIF87_01810 [Pseudomonadota bacterium]
MKHPDLNILYLVFNRKAKKEADAKFPKKVKIRTIHSLAFASNSARWKDQVGAFTIADMLPAFKGQKNAQQLAALCHDFIELFMNSPFRMVDEAMEVFQKEHLGHVTDKARNLFEGSQKHHRYASVCMIPFPHHHFLLVPKSDDSCITHYTKLKNWILNRMFFDKEIGKDQDVAME